MRQLKRATLLTVAGFLCLTTVLLAQTYQGALQGDLSVIGSDGVFYLVTAPAIIPSTPDGQTPPSKLEAFDLDRNSKKALNSLEFSGMATHLLIGRDNRLFLVVSPLPLFEPVPLGPIFPSSTVLSSKVFPLEADSTRVNPTLYIIPTPFPVSGLNASLESIASKVNINPSRALKNVVKVELEGAVDILKAKVVSNEEYLYVVATTSALPIAEDASPIKTSSKLLIFDSDGKKGQGGRGGGVTLFHRAASQSPVPDPTAQVASDARRECMDSLSLSYFKSTNFPPS